MTYSERKHALVNAKDRLRRAKDEHERQRARAEQSAIDAGKATGKNAEERTRKLVLALFNDDGYTVALGALRVAESGVDAAQADIEIYEEQEQRQRWATRARLAQAIEQLGVEEPEDVLRTPEGWPRAAAVAVVERALERNGERHEAPTPVLTTNTAMEMILTGTCPQWDGSSNDDDDRGA